MTTDLYRNGYDYGYEQGVAAERERAAAAIDALHPRVDALGARAEAAEKRCAELAQQLDDALHTYRCVEETDVYRALYADHAAAKKRCAELELRLDLMTQDYTAAKADLHGADGRIAELERELAREKAGRFGARVAASINLDERDEARRVARVLAGERTQEGHAGWREWQAAKAAALAYPEQKPEPREPSEELTRL